MKIETKKILIRGEKYRIIISVKGMLTERELPKKYVESETDFFFLQNHTTQPGVVIKKIESDFGYGSNEIHNKMFPIKSKYWEEEYINIPEDKFQFLIAVIRKGIKNLREIKKSLPKWEGEETFTF